MILELKNINKSFITKHGSFLKSFLYIFFKGFKLNKRLILSDISFHLKSGESLALIGKNGSGKSTLLKIISKILLPDSGVISLNGTVNSIIELDVGLINNLSVLDNIIFYLKRNNFNDYSHSDIKSILDFSELNDYKYYYVNHLSSGLKMRLSFALATSKRPDLLIVDEALSVGDYKFQVKCFNRIDKFKKEGTAFVFVSHSHDLLLRHCDKAILLNDNKAEYFPDCRSAVHKYLKIQEGSSFVKVNNQTKFLNGSKSSISFKYKNHINPASISIKSFNSIEITFKFKMKYKIVDVIPGILIKTNEDKIIFGTNSLINGDQPIKLTKNTGSYKFKFNCKLTNGVYFISFGLSSGDDLKSLKIIEKFDNIIELKVHNSKKYIGYCDLSI